MCNICEIFQSREIYLILLSVIYSLSIQPCFVDLKYLNIWNNQLVYRDFNDFLAKYFRNREPLSFFLKGTLYAWDGAAPTMS